MTKYSTNNKSKQDEPQMKATNSKYDKSCIGCCAKYTVFILFVFGLTVFFDLRYVFGINSHPSNALETAVRDVGNDLNSLMCESFRVSTREATDMFLVPGRAEVDPHKHITVKRHGAELFPASTELKNSFNLLEKSRIHVQACRKRPEYPRAYIHRHDHPREYFKDVIEILIFKGYDSWTDWINWKCDDCPIKRKQIKFCDESDTLMKFKVEERDSYYVAVTYRNDRSVAALNVDAHLEVNMTTFNTRHAEQSCLMATECTFNLTYSHSVDVVLRSPQLYRSFTTECQYRVMFWVGIFGILPLCLILLGCCCCTCLHVASQRDSKRDIGKSKDRFKERMMPPPSYDSISRQGSIQTA